MSGVGFELRKEEEQLLGLLAVTSIVSRLQGMDNSPDRVCSEQDLSATVRKELGSFVTLHKGGNLRGCIGTIVGREPLWRNVWRMARAAAFEDPRFAPLKAPEWTQVSMEISVLGPLAPCTDTAAIEIGRHGLLLAHAGHSGVFLPQVPVEQGWDVPAYLHHLCLKAGLAPGSWEKPGAQLYWYEARVFPVEKV